MLRKTTGAILCPSCGRLTNADAAECLVCGQRRPGLWGFAGAFRGIFRANRFTDVITAVCVVLYVVTLVIDPLDALRPRGPLSLFAPSQHALDVLGMSGLYAWQHGRWWTLLTAMYLHGDLLHILFNVLWIRQLGPAVEEAFGPARFFIVFTVAGAAGFAGSIAVGIPFTIGASGSIFGLLGAMVAFGRRRGGTFGSMVLRHYGQWAVILFVLGLFGMSNVNNVAHAGGFVGGFLTGLVVSYSERRAETFPERVVAVALGALTAVAFGLALLTGLAGG
jgi:rhomboid protease GluP